MTTENITNSVYECTRCPAGTTTIFPASTSLDDCSKWLEKDKGVGLLYFYFLNISLWGFKHVEIQQQVIKGFTNMYCTRDFSCVILLRSLILAS